MCDQSIISDQIKFEDNPSNQEFLNSYLPALEEQYSYDRLKGLPSSHLERKFDHVNHELNLLRWRLHILDNNWLTRSIVAEGTNLEKSIELEPPTLNQIVRINWTIVRIERNLNKAIHEAKKREGSGIFHRIKSGSIESKHIGRFELELFKKEAD